RRRHPRQICREAGQKRGRIAPHRRRLGSAGLLRRNPRHPNLTLLYLLRFSVCFWLLERVYRMSAEAQVEVPVDGKTTANGGAAAADTQETREWLDSMEYVLRHAGPERANRLLQELGGYLGRQGISLPFAATTPYYNT